MQKVLFKLEGIMWVISTLKKFLLAQHTHYFYY